MNTESFKESTTRNDSSGGGRLRINKQFSVLLVCLLIATLFWLLLALSREYPATISFPVSYSNLPARKVIMNELPSEVSLHLKTSGFRILSYDFRKEKRPIQIDVGSRISSAAVGGEMVSIPTQAFLTDFSRQLGTKIEITGFQPDSIVLLFTDRSYRKVPVSADVSYILAKQFDTIQSLRVIPDSVTISGPPSVINELTEVKTERLQLKDVKSTVNRPLKLVLNGIVECQPSQVQMILPVEEYTEGRQDILLHPINLDRRFVLKTFPEKVTVRYQVSLSNYGKITANQFDAVVDASKLPDYDGDRLKVQVMILPEQVRSVFIEPEEVEFILRKK